MWRDYDLDRVGRRLGGGNPIDEKLCRETRVAKTGADQLRDLDDKKIRFGSDKEVNGPDLDRCHDRGHVGDPGLNLGQLASSTR